MATSVPVIQVLSKNDYEEQHLVSLPKAFPLSALASSSIRIRSSVLALTTNNFTYARIGHLLGWWDVHPLPQSIPAEYSDPTKFGCISAWGYAEILESNVSGLEVGTQFYGYLPIGTLPFDMEVKINPNIAGQFVEVSKRREKQLPVYNLYLYFPPDSKEAGDKESQGWDALMYILFQTGYMLNRYVFAWEASEIVQPSGNATDGWNPQLAALDDNSIVLIFAASGKTALGLAYTMKYDRPAGKKPRTIFGVGSVRSKAFTENTGLYDSVLTYDSDSGDLGKQLGLTPDTKIAVLDFGARDSAADRWAAKLRQSQNNVVQIQIAGEFTKLTPEEATANFLNSTKVVGYKAIVNASRMRSQAMDNVGEKRFFDDFSKLWTRVQKGGWIKGVRLVWGEGMGDLGKGWEKLAKGEVGPDQGLVFSLNGDPTGKL